MRGGFVRNFSSLCANALKSLIPHARQRLAQLWWKPLRDSNPLSCVFVCVLLRGLVSRLNARLLLKYCNCERKRQPRAGRVLVCNWGFTSFSTAETDKWSKQGKKKKKKKSHFPPPPTMLSICSLPSSWLIEKVTTLVLGRVAGALSVRVPLIGLVLSSCEWMRRVTIWMLALPPHPPTV